MKRVFFHILTDGKTLKLLSYKQYKKASKRIGWLVGWVDSEEVYLRKTGQQSLWISWELLGQLMRRVITDEKKGSG